MNMRIAYCEAFVGYAELIPKSLAPNFNLFDVF